MMQPAGRLCGFPPSLSFFLRISPILCAFDGLAAVGGILAYKFKNGFSFRTAVGKVMHARRGSDKETKHGRLRAIQESLLARILCFVVSALPPVFRLLVSSGLLWPSVCACCYFFPFLILEAMGQYDPTRKTKASDPEQGYRLEELLSPSEEQGSSPGNQESTLEEQNKNNKKMERRIAQFEYGCGILGLLIQLALLSCVDLAGKPPDADWRSRYAFRLLRLGANLVALFVHVPIIYTLKALNAPRRILTRRLGNLFMGMVLVYTFVTYIEGLRFSRRYFMISIMISFFSWSLSTFEGTRFHILQCDENHDGEDDKEGQENEGQENEGYWNVLAFDFFLRILGFSIFWFAKYYNPAGTYQPGWANIIGG
ncbi:hypothetical protein V8E51_012945 [Hyaloscypha variabilis]